LGLEGQLLLVGRRRERFFDEARFMLAKQMARRTRRSGSTTGLHWGYGVDGPGRATITSIPSPAKLTKSKSAYEASAAARLLHPGRR